VPKDAAVMLNLVEGIKDKLWKIILHPPLSPGSANNDIESINDDINTINLNNTTHRDPLILRYLPLLVLLTLFWPVLLTLIAASVSASGWLVWLCVGAAFGLLQLVYVLYNFAMIVWDVSALTMLKSMALLRSLFRYYFFKMTDAAGIEVKGRTKRYSKKRRRKEWREEVDRATSYEEYCKIELYEPQQQQEVQVSPAKPKILRRIVSIGSGSPQKESSSSSSSSSSRFGGLRLRRRRVVDTKSPPSSPRLPQNPMSSPMRRIQSSNTFDMASSSSKQRWGSTSSAFRRSTSTDESEIPLRRASSSIMLSESNDEEDINENCPKWQQVVNEDLGMAGDMLLTTLARLKEARIQASSMNVEKKHYENEIGNTDDNIGDTRKSFHITSFTSGTPSTPSKRKLVHEDYSSSLKTLLSGIVKRNHLSVDDSLLQDARSVAERGQHSLRKETREAIDRYGEEVTKCLDWVASGTVYLGKDSSDTTTNTNTQEQIMQKQHNELSKRYTLFKRMKQNMGHTALMLSGGGAQAMYHLGTIKALIESGMYQHIHVISGTSGGSIAAAMTAIKTPEELIRDICVNTVSTDYMLNGEMKRLGVSWFPPITKMVELWFKEKLVMDSKEFLNCCQFYYKDITFEEAYEMTKKHVCITVSASRASSGSGVQRLLLNHISTPNVTLASAVAASCAVPGIMAPAKLMIKDSRGKLVPFEVDGVEWIDGSVQADLPFKRISTLFNISNFVVAQTNFHVVPFINKAHHPNINTLYWKLFQMCMWDAKSRVLNLSQLGLFPKIFGQDLSKMFNQKYYGKLTLVPRFTTMQLFGLKVLSNPTVKDMDNYLQNGQLAAWPFLRVLKEMLRIERSIDAGLSKLEQRLSSVRAGHDMHLPNDDIDSLSSAPDTTYRAREPGLFREAELLKVKVKDLENENKQLRKQVMRLQRSMGISSHSAIPPISTLEGKTISISPVEEDTPLVEDTVLEMAGYGIALNS